MFSPRFSSFRPVLLAGALVLPSQLPVWAASPAKKSVKTAPRFATQISHTGWNYEFADDALESRWSFRAPAQLGSGSEIRVVFGWRDVKNYAVLSLHNRENRNLAVLYQVSDGRVMAGSSSGAPFGAQGELTLQKVGNRVRALWDGAIVAQTTLEAGPASAGRQIGWATRGSAKIEGDSAQPTENALLRDDFMRAQGPDEKEIPGEWKTAGIWKTSGSLGPKSDAALNPNPFVFRAQGANLNAARAGKWWWSDYGVTASIRATQNDEKAPLVAGIEAFSDGKNGGLRGEIDFSRGVAFLKNGDKILAQSAVFDAEPGEWHRVRLEPGPGVAKLFVDGILRVSAPSNLAQGSVALRAMAGTSNFVDFDDVRVGTPQNGEQWGEGALPDRFQKDRLMKSWASEASAWKRDGNGIWWHTGDFFGAATLQMPLPPLESGDGLEWFFAGDPKNEKAGARYEIVRPGAKNEIVARLKTDGAAKSEIVALAGEPKSLRLSFEPQKDGSFKISSALGEQKIGAAQTSLSARGTKIGIRPLKNGKPLPPPSLQKLSIASATFERENRAVIGVNITPVSEEIMRQLGLPDPSGAIVDNVETQSPAFKAGVREGDVIRFVDGARVTDVDSMRAAVGAAKPGAVLKFEILRPQSDASGLDWEKISATTPNRLDYSFTAAPVDWRAARGSWEVAERWTCSPQWSFVAGQNDAAPLLWSRFATRGDWTLEAYLATPMDLARGERSPSDLNVSVGGDGVDLSSGYSFIFAGKNRSVNQIRRGDAVAWEKPFTLPPGAGDTHQDYFYIRIERRQTPGGARFIYSVNGREMANYLDPKPLPDGGHIGLWTQNGGLSVARVRLWHAELRTPVAQKNPVLSAKSASGMKNALGIWTPRGEGRDVSARIVLTSQNDEKTEPKSAKPALQISNPRSGGDWTTFVSRQSFDAKTHPILEWDYRAENGVKLNLYALIDGTWREIAWTAGPSSSDENDQNQLGAIAGALADGKWHHARFDLAAVLARKGIRGRVESLAFAAPDHDYLRSGLGGNNRGASYWLANFRAK